MKTQQNNEPLLGSIQGAGRRALSESDWSSLIAVPIQQQTLSDLLIFLKQSIAVIYKQFGLEAGQIDDPNRFECISEANFEGNPLVLVQAIQKLSQSFAYWKMGEFLYSRTAEELGAAALLIQPPSELRSGFKVLKNVLENYERSLEGLFLRYSFLEDQACKSMAPKIFGVLLDLSSRRQNLSVTQQAYFDLLQGREYLGEPSDLDQAFPELQSIIDSRPDVASFWRYLPSDRLLEVRRCLLRFIQGQLDSLGQREALMTLILLACEGVAYSKLSEAEKKKRLMEIHHHYSLRFADFPDHLLGFATRYKQALFEKRELFKPFFTFSAYSRYQDYSSIETQKNAPVRVSQTLSRQTACIKFLLLRNLIETKAEGWTVERWMQVVDFLDQRRNRWDAWWLMFFHSHTQSAKYLLKWAALHPEFLSALKKLPEPQQKDQTTLAKLKRMALSEPAEHKTEEAACARFKKWMDKSLTMKEATLFEGKSSRAQHRRAYSANDAERFVDVPL